MKALAEFILRGRIQAVAVAMMGSFFPFIGQSAIALVSLAKGATQGFWIFMWVSLPLVLLHYMSADNPLIIALSIASLGLMVFAGVMHQSLASWQWTTVATIVASVIVAIGLGSLMAESVDNLMNQIMAVIAEISNMQDRGLQPMAITRSSLLGGVAMLLSLGCIISLMIARWWQALIYNPGGFQEEFHQFTIESKITVILVGAMLLVLLLPEDYRFWVTLPSIPFLLAGIALVHFAVKLFQLGMHWLVMFYLAMLLFGAFMAVFLMGLAIGDSFLNLRRTLIEYKKRKY